MFSRRTKISKCVILSAFLSACVRYFALDGEMSECASTRSQAGAWWLVDLGSRHRVEKVTITNAPGADGRFFS